MKKQVFENGSIKTKKILPIKTEKEKLVERLEKTKSVLDFYNQKEKILKILRETRE
ncbi:unnamed protein product [marine sediment metagenome]|uniref:Uncharacterized protein n=1 Tax=marine sediment metagenome TaxID=412755 RepID=X1BHE9_9ZZZZ